MKSPEFYISVDIESSGPIPGEFSLLSLGACVVYEPEYTFECIVKPINSNADPEALKVTGFDLAELNLTGEEPKAAFERFERWILEHADSRGKPIFVGLNAAFDWSFVNYYFHYFLGRNPFGFSALDIKALYMGAFESLWADTKSSLMSKNLKPAHSGNHNALTDAIFQAELFRLIKKG